MKIAILAEKASQLRECLPAIAAHHAPSHPITALCLHPYANLWQRFSYPRGLGLADYPLAKAPTYKPIDLDSGTALWLDAGTGPWDHASTFARSDAARGAAAFRDADKIIAIPDWDPSGCLMATQALDQLLPLGHADPQVGFILLKALDQATIRKALASAGTTAGAVAAMAAAGRIKQRLDYNYAMNANVILRRIQERVGLPAGTPALSKYALQLLYGLRRSEPASEGGMIERMSKWRGSGRYAPARNPGLGSPASRHSIIQALQAAGLCEQAGTRTRTLAGPAGGRMVTTALLGISDAGRRLLEALHPDCEDPDLPFRILAWQDLPEDEANARSDRYVRTFFGKMARFGAKGRA